MEVDVMLYMKEKVGPSEGYELAGGLRRLDGVLDVRFNPERQRLIQVIYDPDRTEAHAFVRKLAEAGWEARLIGG